MTKIERVYRGVRVLRWIESQGVVFYTGKAERETAKRYLRHMPRVFPEYISRLNAIYLYRMGEQEDKTHDAIIWNDVTSDIGTLYAVGISLEALARGEEYTQLVFTHELAHLDVPKHGGSFRMNLSGLLGRYNRATGARLKNEPPNPEWL